MSRWFDSGLFRAPQLSAELTYQTLVAVMWRGSELLVNYL